MGDLLSLCQRWFFFFFCFYFIIFMCTIDKKFRGQADNSRLLEKIQELATHLQYQWTESEMLVKTKTTTQSSGLSSEKKNLAHDGSRIHTRLEGKMSPNTAPLTFTTRGSEYLNEKTDQEEQKTIQTHQALQWEPLEDVNRDKQAPSAFTILEQHMAVYYGSHAYNELTQCLIKMLDLKHLKDYIVLYDLHSPLFKC